MTATTAQILAGLAVTASYRYSQHRTAPSDVNSGPTRAEAVDAQGMCAASAPQTLVGAVPPDTAPTRLHGAHRG